MLTIFDEHLLERAKEYVDVSFQTTCHFLSDYLPVNSQSGAYGTISEADLVHLQNLVCHMYNRYSAVMQLYLHYAGISAKEGEGNIIPLHPH